MNIDTQLCLESFTNQNKTKQKQKQNKTKTKQDNLRQQ
jgi:hypothetical protein